VGGRALCFLGIDGYVLLSWFFFPRRIDTIFMVG
jgi:hypothetical protein